MDRKQEMPMNTTMPPRREGQRQARRVEGRLGDAECARSEEPIRLRLADLDRDAWLLNLINGTLNLATAPIRSA